MNNDWPFMTLPVQKVGLFDKFASHKKEENALIEINNILAEKRNIRSLSIADIENVLNKYKLNFDQKLRDKMSCFYKGYLIHCLQDKKLSDEEIQDLHYLKNLFSLDDKTIETINNEQFKNIYRKSYQEAIKDGTISDEEKAFLSSLQNNLRLPEEIVENIRIEEASKYLKAKVDQAITDRRLSPEEEKEIQLIAKNLGVNIKIDDASKYLLDKYKLFWLIENGEVPTIQVPINLPKREKCYFETNAEFYEYRKVTSRIRYSGPTARIKIMKGLYWRMGDLKLQPVSKDVLVKIDNGHLYLSNKKIIFIGTNRSISVQLNKIVNFVPYKDGVEIQKDTGSNQFYSFTNNLDIFVVLLGRALSDIS
jgi:hypothetical protein